MRRCTHLSRCFPGAMQRSSAASQNRNRTNPGARDRPGANRPEPQSFIWITMRAADGDAGTRHARNDWPVAPEMNMRRTRQLNARNRIDLQDADQIRSLKRRLGISNDDLHRLVAKVGNSISAVTK